MRYRARTSFFTLTISAVSFLHVVVSEPVQYCKYGAKTNQIDFCMGMLMHHNVSTTSHDLYLTMSVTRPGSMSLGWTALGLGEIMEGALMFIVYGDPVSTEPPIVSVRKSIGHKQPILVTREDMNGADLRVIRADWHPSSSSPDSAVAMVSLVCYSCHLWPGTEVSVLSKSQPWMWAWNSKQDIPVYTYGVHLDMHAHHAGAGGWGNFYVDMPSSVNNWYNAPSFPPIRPGIYSLGVSETPGTASVYGVAWLKYNPTLYLHGIAMGAAFLLLFPIGVIAMRSGGAKAFKYHWILQIVASCFTGVGFVLGLLLGHKVDTIHQVLGISLVTCVSIQNILGWRHHIVFLRIRRRTWPSHSHMWLGRLVMVVGWINFLTGLVLQEHFSLLIILMGCFVSLEAVGLAAWLWWIKIKANRAGKSHTDERKNDDAEYFALGEEDDDQDNVSLSLEHPEVEEVKPMIWKSERA
ncbi:iron reductase domain protein [Hypoxylon crocopeplum]|nr:iron reductase domain protein [Hypoxylon crocopeplum]